MWQATTISMHSEANYSHVSKYFFNSTSLLRSLPETELQLFKEHLTLKKVKKGRELFREGTSPRWVYIIKRGKVKLYQQTDSGSEQIVYIYIPGELFGYRPSLCQELHPASAKTLEDSAIYFMPVKSFLDILRKSPVLSNILLQNLSHEFTVLVNRIAAFGQKSALERIALSLLILRERYRRADEGREIEITLSRADLASFVGATNETIARLITKLKSEKIITTRGRKIIVSNPNALAALAFF